MPYHAGPDMVSRSLYLQITVLDLLFRSFGRLNPTKQPHHPIDRFPVLLT